jgi:hypothetical protein
MGHILELRIFKIVMKDGLYTDMAHHIDYKN